MHYKIESRRSRISSLFLCNLTDLADRKEDDKDCIKLFRDLRPIFQKDTGIPRDFLMNFN